MAKGRGLCAETVLQGVYDHINEFLIKMKRALYSNLNASSQFLCMYSRFYRNGGMSTDVVNIWLTAYPTKCRKKDGKYITFFPVAFLSIGMFFEEKQYLPQLTHIRCHHLYLQLGSGSAHATWEQYHTQNA